MGERPMIEQELRSAEDMTEAQLAVYVIDLLHRMMVHHTLWFREVEHQLGFARALAAMDEAWEKTRKVGMARLAEELGFTETDGVPDALQVMPKEKLLRLIDAIAKNWLAQDGLWFQTV